CTGQERTPARPQTNKSRDRQTTGKEQKHEKHPSTKQENGEQPIRHNHGRPRRRTLGYNFKQKTSDVNMRSHSTSAVGGMLDIHQSTDVGLWCICLVLRQIGLHTPDLGWLLLTAVFREKRECLPANRHPTQPSPVCPLQHRHHHSFEDNNTARRSMEHGSRSIH
ncbi:unnamed protein product, partial [Ectocarpus sp. 8 AP-2014]